MATDRECEAAYRRLRPYCDRGDISEDELFVLDEGLAAGEQYYSLSFLISAILEIKVVVPDDVLLDAFNLLEDEDKEEYKPMLDKRLNA